MKDCRGWYGPNAEPTAMVLKLHQIQMSNPSLDDKKMVQGMNYELRRI